MFTGSTNVPGFWAIMMTLYNLTKNTRKFYKKKKSKLYYYEKGYYLGKIIADITILSQWLVF